MISLIAITPQSPPGGAIIVSGETLSPARYGRVFSGSGRGGWIDMLAAPPSGFFRFLTQAAAERDKILQLAAQPRFYDFGIPEMAIKADVSVLLGPGSAGSNSDVMENSLRSHSQSLQAGNAARRDPGAGPPRGKNREKEELSWNFPELQLPAGRVQQAEEAAPGRSTPDSGYPHWACAAIMPSLTFTGLQKKYLNRELGGRQLRGGWSQSSRNIQASGGKYKCATKNIE